MAEGAAQATKAAHAAQRPAPAARQALARPAVLRRMVSQPGEAAGRSAGARSVRGQGGAFPAHSRSPRQGQYAPPARTAQAGRDTPVPHAQRGCACGGACRGCKGEQGLHERHAAKTGDREIGSDAKHQAVPVFGPRSDGLDDAPYFGPASPPGDAQFGPGTGTGMSCVIGPMRLVTSGPLEGGYTVHDYLSGGKSWGNVNSPGTAGVDRTGVKVQLAADYSGDTSLGVSQSFTFSGANQAFLDTAAQYLGQRPGSVANGVAINEPVLNAGNHYAHTGWELQYGAKTGSGTPSLVSFADVPRNGPGSKGSVDFRTCFYSRGGPCQASEACRTWRWTIDFTGTNNVNTVT